MTVHRMTLKELSNWFGRLAGQTKANQAGAMREVGKLLETSAKGLIGQEGVNGAGGFPDWAPLADSTVDAKKKKGQTGRISATDPLYGTGKLRDSIRSTSSLRRVTLGSSSPIMKYMEQGTKNMPPRSVLGITVSSKAEEATSIIARRILGPVVGRGK